MLRRSSPKESPPEVRREAQEQALVALQRWLDLEAGATRRAWGPVRRVGPWPYVNILVGLGSVLFAAALGGPDEIAITFGCGGALLASVSFGTLLERLRERGRLSAMMRGAACGVALTSPAQETPLPPVPEAALPNAIASPLARARSACAGIARIAGDHAWTRYQVPVKEHEVSARAQLQALEEWAQRLAMIDGLLAPAGGSGQVPPHLQELAGIYEEHSKRLLAAAEAFERAQASLARALLALTTGPQRAGAPDTAVREIGAAFDSLAQVLESLGRAPAVGELTEPAAPAPRPQPVRG